MQNNNSNGSCAESVRGFMAICAIMLAAGGVSMVSRAEAAPFAYVANVKVRKDIGVPNISVIDTATNKVVATIPVPVGNSPFGVAVTPDGKHVYVANDFSNNVSVIDTGTNKVAATVTVGNGPFAVAVTPDGRHAYVTGSNVSVIDTMTNTVVATVGVASGPVAVTQDGKHAYVEVSGGVSVIDTATNKVVATIPVGSGAGSGGVAVTPDGTHVYLANYSGDPITVSVIDTATKKVVATIPLVPGTGSGGIAVAPDGKHVYVANFEALDVSVIDTVTNTVVATVPTGEASGIAVTPDGKHVYVPDYASDAVSVIDTVTNTVVAGVNLGDIARPETFAVGIAPPPPGVPFLAFSAKLDIAFSGAPSQDSFNLYSQFTLSSTAPAIHPHIEPVTLQVGTFAVTIPPGSFKKTPDGSFTFAGVINGVSLQASIKPTGTLRYAFNASATDASLTGTKNEVYVPLIIGGDSGAASVMAQITP